MALVKTAERLEYEKAYREANKQRISEYHKQRYIDNKEKVLSQAKNYYQLNKEIITAKHKKYRDSNKEVLNAQKKVYASLNDEKIKLRHKLWYQNNKESIKAQQKIYLANNLEKFRLKRANRRATIIMRTPSWNCEFNDFAIQELYSLAALRTKVTNISWHVDHIIPLKGKKVSGLHVANNLQVITSLENCVKANKYEVSI